MVADVVHGDGHGHAGVHGQHRPQRADDLRGSGVARPGHHTAVPDVPGYRSRTRPRHTAPPRRSGTGWPPDLDQFMDKWQAGKESDLQAGLRTVANRSTTNWTRPAPVGGRHHRDHAPSPATDRGAPGSDARTPRRGAARGVSGPRCCCSCRRGSSGSSSSSMYPMVSSLYFSFTQYDLSRPVMGRDRQLQVHVHARTSVFWNAIKNTIWIIVVGGPAADPVRDRHGDAADAASEGRRRCTARCTSCRRIAPAVAAVARLRVPVQPGISDRSTASCRDWAWQAADVVLARPGPRSGRW